MEDSSTRPSVSEQPVPAPCKFLSSLPSRGLLSSTVISSNPGGMRVYICDHNTSPPESQEIKTNQQNILIRSLTLKKQKCDSSSKDVKGATTDSSRKRAAERASVSRLSAKKANTSSGQEGPSSRPGEKNYYALTVERLRALLREKGLSLKGKKEELITRLKSVNG